MATVKDINADILGDRALVLRVGSGIDAAASAQVLAVHKALAAAAIPGVIDLVPAYTTVTVHYDWTALPPEAQDQPWDWLRTRLLAAATRAMPDGVEAPVVEVPVCYLPPHAPDLADVAALAGLAPAAVVAAHCAPVYRVAFLGFRPGFPYLLGLDAGLDVPRLDRPRAQVPAGSVGIGGRQTGVYPAAGPGGWRLIGHCPIPLFDPSRPQPAALVPGDRVRFVAIDTDRHAQLCADAEPAAPLPGPAAADTAIDVLRPGIHSSVQDLGRPGFRHLGIGAGGASDLVAARLANQLVGNPAGAPLLELTLSGPELRTQVAVVLALTGAGMRAVVGQAELPFDRPVAVAAGSRLRFHATGEGARAWLAVAGGIAAPTWFGSSAVDVGSGLFGRTLAEGDRIALDTPPASIPAAGGGFRPAPWWIQTPVEVEQPAMLRFVIDREADASVIAELAGRVWQVGHAADRRGLRLEGKPLAVRADGNRVSAGVLHGTIQLPADGQPILLGPDGQTVGGYPVLGHVIEADLGRLAQLKPGDGAWLQPCSLSEAHAARMRQQVLLGRLGVAIRARVG